MTLEASLKALKSAFTGKTAEASALAGEVAALKAKNDTLASELATLNERLVEASAAIAERDALAARIEELTKSLSTAEAAKVAAVAEVKSVGAKAAEIVAKAGAEPVEIAPQSAQKSPAELWDEYLAMPNGKAKVDFYETHRSAFMKLLGIK